ncbi:MAG: cell division protein FtsL [Desulfobacterales bacterium]|nr:MAG: cell division protein FtsL [Desulfobacterales bacterium]
MMQKKAPRRNRSAKVTLMCIVLMGLFIGELLFYTWCRVQCVRTRYEISEENARYQRLMTLQDNLKIELAHLKSPRRIARIARTQLGLVTPSREQLILIP